MAKVRLISVGSRGDLQPYLAILLELQRLGHQVSLIGSVNFQAVADAHALPFVPLPGDFTSLLSSEAGLAPPGISPFWASPPHQPAAMAAAQGIESAAGSTAAATGWSACSSGVRTPG